jgi:hypothetical protein
LVISKSYEHPLTGPPSGFLLLSTRSLGKEFSVLLLQIKVSYVPFFLHHPHSPDTARGHLPCSLLQTLGKTFNILPLKGERGADEIWDIIPLLK